MPGRTPGPSGDTPDDSAGSRHVGGGRWPEVLKAHEVADYLRVSYLTVLRMTHAGQLNAIRVGREFRYLREEIDRLLRAPAGPPPAGDGSDTGSAGAGGAGTEGNDGTED